MEAASSSSRKVSRNARYLVLLPILWFLVYMFAWRGMRFFLIPSDSMGPTLLRNDYIVTLNYGRPPRDPERFDIVVFKDPEDPSAYDVKRVIGLPGEEVAIQEGAVLINGQYISDPYRREPAVYKYEPQVVPQNQYFVLGDNRNWSSDSSLWKKSVPRSDIVGRAVFIYNPIRRMGRIR